MQRLSCRADARRAAVPGAAAEPGADTRAALHRYLAVLERRYGDASTTASRDGGSTRPASARAAPSAEAALGLGFSRQFHALAARLGDERRRAGRRARGALLRQPACCALTMVLHRQGGLSWPAMKRSRVLADRCGLPAPLRIGSQAYS